MINRHIVFVFDCFFLNLMLRVTCFRFEGRKGDPASADYRFARCMNYISAHGTNIKSSSEHI